MMNKAAARVAEFKYFRRQPRKAILVLRITKGPKTEVGKEVHLVLTKVDLPVLREIVLSVESQEDS